MALGNNQLAVDLYDFAVIQQKQNALKPEFAQEMAKQNPAELGSIRMLLSALGMGMGDPDPKTIGADSLYTLERGPQYPSYNVRVQPVATGPGNPVTVSITDSTAAAPFYTPVRELEDIAHPTTREMAKVLSITSIAVGNTTFVVQPWSSDVDWALTPIFPGSKLPRFGQLMGDVSHGVKTLVGDNDVYRFYKGQLRESYNISGSALTQGQLWVGDQAYVPQMMQWGNIWPEQQDRFILTTQPDQRALAAASPISNMTYQPIGAAGLIPAINGDLIFPGNPDGHPGGISITKGGPLQLSHFESFSAQQKNRANACRNYIYACDRLDALEFRQLILATGGTIDAWGPLTIPGGIEIGNKFMKLVHDGITYQCVEIEAFNTELGLGGPGSGYSNYGILIPVDRFVPNFMGGKPIARMKMFNGGPSENRCWYNGTLGGDTWVVDDKTMNISQLANPTVGWAMGTHDRDETGFEKLWKMGMAYYDLSYFGQMRR
jgi:hypothetical protein